jgi:hypothetical protein
MNHKTFICINILLTISIGCNNPHKETEIMESMKTYDRLIMKTDADSIAELYTENGELGNAATGRDSIRRLLKSLKDIRVINQVSTTSSVLLMCDTAIQEGNYIQCAIISGEDTVTVKGTFKARWEWNNHKGWRIRKMRTISLE